jgi:hypothetical protein
MNCNVKAIDPAVLAAIEIVITGPAVELGRGSFPTEVAVGKTSE